MTLYPQQIIDALKTVRYPGSGKNIVEMGMVEDDLRIAGLHVSFSLLFDKPTNPFLKSLVKAAEAAIHAYVGKEVEVEVKTKTQSTPNAERAAGTPDFSNLGNIIAVSSGKGVLRQRWSRKEHRSSKPGRGACTSGPPCGIAGLRHLRPLCSQDVPD